MNQDSNGLTELPSEIWSLTTLSRVMWRKCCIKAIALGNRRKSIEWLFLTFWLCFYRTRAGDNEITELPSNGIKLLTNLERLMLRKFVKGSDGSENVCAAMSSN